MRNAIKNHKAGKPDRWQESVANLEIVVRESLSKKVTFKQRPV